MIVNVRLFARARDLAGTDQVAIDVPTSARVADLRSALAQRLPELSPFVANLLMAVGTEYADDSAPLDSTSEVACFPPVSGG
jgi:molybdopterin converting factor subunit 1